MQAKNILYAACAMIALAGCKNNVDFKKTKGGMPYKLYTSGKGEKVKVGQVIKIHYSQKLNDSTLASSYEKGPSYLPISGQTSPYDISEVIPDLRKGDSVYAVQMIDTFIKQNPQMVPPQFKKGDKMITTIKVLDVFASQDLAQADQIKERDKAFRSDKKVQEQLRKDQQQLEAYLKQNNIQAQKTENGVYYSVTTTGAGPEIQKGSNVSLMYKGMTLAGKVFDTNMDSSFKHTDPLTFKVGQGQMLPGFDEAVEKLKKGDRARIFIPSSLAYGANPPSPAIGPNENLIFDVVVTEVTDKEAPGEPHQDH